MKIKIYNAEGAVFVKKYKVVGIGNAVVDVISQSSDTFLQRMGIEKGIMQLIEKERAEALYGASTTTRFCDSSAPPIRARCASG